MERTTAAASKLGALDAEAKRQIAGFTFAVLGMILIVLLLCIHFRSGRGYGRGAAHIGEVVAEFGKIAPPRDAVAAGDVSTKVMGDGASRGKSYFAGESWSAVLDDYDWQLERNGWIRRGTIPYDGQPEVIWCKHGMSASLQLGATEPVLNAPYSFFVSWGDVAIQDCGR